MSAEVLGKIRQEIDEVDDELVRLLNHRLTLAIGVSAAKLAERKPVLDGTREDEVIEHVCRVNQGPMTDDQLVALYLELMQQSRHLQDTLRANPDAELGKTPPSIDWHIPSIDPLISRP